MGIKIVFIGNIFGGDDGIGPYLYNELENSLELSDFELLELGVIGFDLVSYVGDGDKLIIVDAIKANKDIGNVVVLGEDDLSPDFDIVSQHDFGVEQTAAILRHYRPGLKSFNIVGINVENVNAFSEKLSEDIMGKMDVIKGDVIKEILNIARAK